MQQTTENVETPAKPLKGKYDGRGKYDRSHLKRSVIDKPGPKPKYIQSLNRTSALKVLKAFELIASLADIYRAAWDKNNLNLCVQMYESMQDRLFGKPFVAINPAESKQSATLHQDNRLQVAIQQLVVTGKRAKGKKAKQIEAVSGVTEAPSTIDAQQADGSDSTQVIDNTAHQPS